MKQKTNSKLVETVKRNGNDISAQAQIHVNNNETSHEVVEPKDDTDLTSYRPVLDLLHARRVSPVVLTHKPAQSARYPDSLTSFAPSVRKSANVLTTLLNVVLSCVIFS